MPDSTSVYCRSRPLMGSVTRVAETVARSILSLLVACSMCLIPAAASAQTGTGAGPIILDQPGIAATWFVANNETLLMLAGPSDGDSDQSYQLLAINMDGGEIRRLDTFPVLCPCDIELAASADGDQIIVSDGMRLRLINTEQGIVRNLVTLDTPSIRQIQIGADGQMFAFVLAHDASLAGTTRTFERGVYVISGARGAVRQLIGPAGVAQLLGITATQVEEFAPRGGGPRLYVSVGGTRATFSVYIADAQPPLSSSHQFLVVDIDQAALRAQVPLAVMPAAPAVVQESVPEIASSAETGITESTEVDAGEDAATSGPPAPAATPSPVPDTAITVTVTATPTTTITAIVPTTTPTATESAEVSAPENDQNRTTSTLSLSPPAGWQTDEETDGATVLRPEPGSSDVLTETELVQIRVSPASTQVRSAEALLAELSAETTPFTIFAAPEAMTLGDTQAIAIGLQEENGGILINRLVIILLDADGLPHQINVTAPAAQWDETWPDLESILQTLDSGSTGGEE